MDQLMGMIWEVTKYVCGCCKEEADYMFNLEDNIESLKHKWSNLQDMKADVEAQVEETENSGEMQRIHQLQGWFQQIQDIQKEIEDTSVQGSLEMQNKCICECCPKNCVSSYKLGKHAAKLLKRVDELLTTGKSYCTTDEIVHKLQPRSIEMLIDDTVGMDVMVEEVWKSIEEEDVGVIGIYGMGGMGKTTLLKTINNEFENRKPKFDVVMWAVVSKELNYDNIMDNIRKKVGIEDKVWKLYNNQEEKATKIYNVLKRKKFVLLLDDIWEKVDLKMVGVPNPKVHKSQSKVLFTTRNEDVCDKMQAHKKFKVECLSEKKAFELFCMKVGEETLKSHREIPNLARDMADECKGLPLALVVVGSAMAGVKSLGVWKYSKEKLTSSSWTTSGLETVFSVLKFSYDRLPDEIHRNCFLYCALYQEDYEIPVFDLIDKWISEGFLGEVTTKSIEDMRDIGECVIEKLKHSCLLESVENDLFLDRTIKMHDMIHDMALWLARDQDKNKNKILVLGESSRLVSQDGVETCKVVERVSTIDYGELFVPVANCPNLTTLMFRTKRDFGKQYLILSNVNHMSKLKVLHLSCGETISLLVPVEMGCLVHLEYLSLEGAMYESEFPTELKNLRKLKYLSLNVTQGDLISIPLEVIANLEELRVLRFLSCAPGFTREEEEFLEKLESLQHLEELEIFLRTGYGVMKFLESTKLQSCVKFLDANIRGFGMQSFLASMSKTKKLQGIRITGSMAFTEDSLVAFNMCSLSMLRKVHISWCHEISHLTWLKYVPLLQVLSITECDSLEELIKGESEDSKGRENIVDQNIFSSLVELKLGYLPKLKWIHNTPLCFASSLRAFVITNCPNLKKVPFDFNTSMHKLKIIIGEQQWWDNLEWEDPTIKHKFHSRFICWH